MKTPKGFPSFGIVIDEIDYKWLINTWADIEKRTNENRFIYEEGDRTMHSIVNANNYKIVVFKTELINFYKSKINRHRTTQMSKLIKELEDSLK